MATNEKDDRGRGQAKAQFSGIVEMVKRLKHCQECSGGEDCKLTDQEIIEGLDTTWKEGQTASEDEKSEYHDEGKARQATDEDPLSVEVRSDWHTPGEGDNKPSEYNILLCTGGPACRITGDLDEHGQPESAHLQHQDWFTPWENLGMSTEEEALLLFYAQQFYFGE